MSKSATDALQFPDLGPTLLEADFLGGCLTSDGGLVWIAEADASLAVTTTLAAVIPEWRTRRPHDLPALLAQRRYQVACGYEDHDDADHLRTDPLMKLVCGRLPETGHDLASQPSFSRLENAVSARTCYRLAQALGEIYLPEREQNGTPTDLVLDFDGTDDPTHGEQERNACARSARRRPCSASTGNDSARRALHRSCARARVIEMAVVRTRPSHRTAGDIGLESLIALDDLKVEYLSPRGPVRAVDGVTFDIHPGEVVGLAGESGSGKSTIAMAILRILQPPAVITGGKVLFGGRDILAMSDSELEDFRWREVSRVFQSAMNALNPVMTIGDQIVDAIRAHTRTSKTDARQRTAELLDVVGIEKARINSYPHELSGGMRQRAVIAIALTLNPPLMIMDEPTTALDVVVQKEIMYQIGELKEKLGFSILFITHDLSLLVEISDRIAIMYAGQIVEMAPARELFEKPLHPYTQGLMQSFPSLTGDKKRLTGIPGSPPDLISPPSGCRFHPRCPKRFEMCDKVVPQLAEVSPGRLVACHLYPEVRAESLTNGD